MAPNSRGSSDHRSRVRLLLPAVLAAMMLVACDTGIFTPLPSRELRIIDVTVNTTRANIDDQITISWDYANADRLGRHQTELVGHYFQSLTPPEVTPLALDARSITFKFIGPLTVVIAAADENGEPTSVAFDILLDPGEFYFSATLTTANIDYPRLGFANGQIRRTIDFSSFLGFYDAGTAGVIDGLELDDLFPGLSADQAFRALSPLEFESQNFGFVQGIAFPFLDPGFKATAEGQQFLEQTRANAILYGGATAYDGTPITIKTDAGLAEGREDVTSAIEAIFIAIDIRTTDANGGGSPYIADVHVGNLAQNLVVSIFHGIRAPELFQSTLGVWESELKFGIWNDPSLLIAQGSINGGYIEEDKTDLNNDLQIIGLGLEKILWRMPYYPDTRILDVPTITF